MSKSIWHLRRSPLPEQTGTVIVGAGIAGISAGLALESRGEPVIILEQHQPGWGASGRNAGFLMRGAADNYAAAVRDLGRQHAKSLWTLTEDNLKRLRSRGIESLQHCQPLPSCLVAFDEEEESELLESMRLLREDGFDADLIQPESNSDALWEHHPPRVGLVNPNDAVCDPIELLQHLRNQLQSPVFAGSTVNGYAEDRSGVLVHSDRGTIRAKRLLLCTNAYTATVLSSHGQHIVPNRGQMLALDASGLPTPQHLRYAYYANHGSEYFRQVDERTIIVGGWRKHHAAEEKTLDNHPTEPVQTGLEKFARRVLGRPLPVTHRWAGTMGFTPDGLPLAGPVEQNGKAVWICAGFTGHGMSMAHELASRTVEAMLDGTAPPELFNPHRFTDSA